MSSTLLRVCIAISLLPVYVAVQLLPILPAALLKSRLLLTKSGRRRLVRLADSYRDEEEQRATEQWKGSFQFKSEQLLRNGDARGAIDSLSWSPRMETFEVDGAHVNVVHEQPAAGQFRSGKKILLLHGNPSWSFMWRNVSAH